MSKKRTKRRVKKGPAPNKLVQPRSRFTKQRIFLYALGILMIVSMAIGLIVSALAPSGASF
jgi:hypothetical protein